MTPPPLTFNAWLRYDVVMRLLCGLDAVTSVLEIGAGEGALAARLARRYKYVGLEPDARAFAVAQSRLARVGSGVVLQGDLSKLEPGTIFDLVCAFEVLEHIEDDAAALRAWRERVRPRGWILLSVPAFSRRFAATDVHAGHYRRYDPPHLRTLLTATGFVDPLVLTYGFPLGYLLEAARNAIASRYSIGGSKEERTASSGRWLQPPAAAWWATQLATAPFRLLQRPFTRTTLGTGLVALARKEG